MYTSIGIPSGPGALPFFAFRSAASSTSRISGSSWNRLRGTGTGGLGLSQKYCVKSLGSRRGPLAPVSSASRRLRRTIAATSATDRASAAFRKRTCVASRVVWRWCFTNRWMVLVIVWICFHAVCFSAGVCAVLYIRRWARPRSLAIRSICMVQPLRNRAGLALTFVSQGRLISVINSL